MAAFAGSWPAAIPAQGEEEGIPAGPIHVN